MKLFYFYIGGSMPGAKIELHDVAFAIGENIETCLDQVRAQWWGTPESLHLDCWGELNHADGHDIVLLPNPPAADAAKLYFVNLGGYVDGDFTEQHKNMLVVAPTASKAKVRALKNILTWQGHHMDEQMEVEHCHDVQQILAQHRLYIHLQPSTEVKPFNFSSGYRPIGRPLS